MSTTISATKVREQPRVTATQKEPRKVLDTKWLARGIAGAVVAAATIAGIMLWLDSRHYETTDDAQVDGHFAELSTRIEGTVVWVNPNAENDHTVKAGDLLLELDPRDYEVALEKAKADLKVRQSQARAARLVVPITDASAFNQLRAAEAARQEAVAGVETAQADLLGAQHRLERDEDLAGRAERDRVRYQALVEKREISRSDYDARETEALATAQAVESDRAAIAADERKVAQGGSVVAQREAQIESARTAPQQLQNARASSDSAQGEIDQALAEVHAAELNLSYAKIYAPVGGVVGHKTVEVGHRVQPGQTLLTVVPLEDIWITANFKETQLRHMCAGQPVTIHVDSFDKDYKGVIENMAGASGPLFSLFPPENATGNYVKIVQRFPVRVHIGKDQDPEHNLRPGMSVEAKARVN
ncbi:MAG TPA: HlyD family secretion protein [Bryobacteraceae bacterium]|nr:HlyD family secretion protein [Bryobacteraceae bacterium]